MWFFIVKGVITNGCRGLRGGRIGVRSARAGIGTKGRKSMTLTPEQFEEWLRMGFKRRPGLYGGKGEVVPEKPKEPIVERPKAIVEPPARDRKQEIADKDDGDVVEDFWEGQEEG